MANKMSDVYILQGICGDLAYSSIYTVGIYTTAELADEAKRKFIAELTEMKGRYTIDESDMLLKEYMASDCEDILPKKLKDFAHWYYEVQPEQYSIESISVIEQPLNKMIFKFTIDGI